MWGAVTPIDEIVAIGREIVKGKKQWTNTLTVKQHNSTHIVMKEKKKTILTFSFCDYTVIKSKDLPCDKLQIRCSKSS